MKVKTRKALRRLVLTVIAVLALFLLAGHLARWFQVFDAPGVFRLHLVPVLGLLLAATFRLKMPVLRLFAGSVAMLSVVSIAPFVREAGHGPLDADWRLFQQNMMVGNANPAFAAQYILDRKPEFVTLQEVDQRALPVLGQLRDRYPGWLQCPAWYGASVVLMSRWKPVAGGLAGCDRIENIGWIRVATPQGELTLVGVHLTWPWPGNYAGRQRRIQRILGELPQPMVIAGDFNMVPWATALQRLERRTGTEVVTPIRFSYRPAGLQLLLPIDHALIPLGLEGRSELVPGLGSDHWGLWVRVGRRKPPP